MSVPHMIPLCFCRLCSRVAVIAVFLFLFAQGSAQAQDLHLPEYDVSRYREVIKANPDQETVILAYLHIGRVSSIWYYAKYDEAVEAYAKVAELYPADPMADDALFYRAHVLHVYAGKLDEAAKAYQQLADRGGVKFDFNEALQIQPEPDVDKGYCSMLAKKLSETSPDVLKLSERISELSKDAKKKAECARSLLDRAAKYETVGAWWAAARDLEQAAGLVKDLTEEKELQGDVLFEAGRFWATTLLEAIRHPIEAVTTGVPSAKSSRRSDVATFAMGCLEQFRSIVPQDGRMDEVLFLIGRCHQERGIEWLMSREAPGKRPLEIKGDDANAVKAFEELLEKYPKSTRVPAALLAMGLSLASFRTIEHDGAKLEFGLKRYDDAMKAFERIVKEFPDSPEAAKAARYKAIVGEVIGGKWGSFEEALGGGSLK
jgi:tetratricopeptide (TPR) repeat protein